MNARSILLNGRTGQSKKIMAEWLSFKEHKVILSGYGNLKMCVKYKDSGGMNLQWNLQHD
jgi:hypothetical protein